MVAPKNSNMEKLDIDYYRGDNRKAKPIVELEFNSKEAYNNFLNWLVLEGQSTDIEREKGRVKNLDGEMKWHYICESEDCPLKCEIFTINTISTHHGCPKSRFGMVANWGNLGLKEMPE